MRLPQKQKRNKRSPLKRKKKKQPPQRLKKKKKRKTKHKTNHLQIFQLIKMNSPVARHNHQITDKKLTIPLKQNKKILKYRQRPMMRQLQPAPVNKMHLMLVQVTHKMVLRRKKTMLPRHRLRKLRPL